MCGLYISWLAAPCLTTFIPIAGWLTAARISHLLCTRVALIDEEEDVNARILGLGGSLKLILEQTCGHLMPKVSPPQPSSRFPSANSQRAPLQLHTPLCRAVHVHLSTPPAANQSGPSRERIRQNFTASLGAQIISSILPGKANKIPFLFYPHVGMCAVSPGCSDKIIWIRTHEAGSEAIKAFLLLCMGAHLAAQERRIYVHLQCARDKEQGAVLLLGREREK